MLKKVKQGVDDVAPRAAELEAEAPGVDYVEFEKAVKEGEPCKEKITEGRAWKGIGEEMMVMMDNK